MRTHQQRQPTINRQYVCATIVHVIFSTFNFIDELFFWFDEKIKMRVKKLYATGKIFA